MYVNKCKSYINFLIACQQWSGIQKEDVDRWISNFKDSSEEAVILAYTILINIIYYSEADIIAVLKEGVCNRLYIDVILKKQIEADFSLSAKALDNVLKDELDASCFIPLLDMDAPHESANSMLRLLVQQNIIQADQSVFLKNINLSNSKYKRIVIIDDCVGSGEQLREFWNEKAVVNVGDVKMLLKDYCVLNPDMKVDYITLFGYSESIHRLRQELLGLRIYCVHNLVDAQRVFSSESFVWQGKDLSHATNVLKDVLDEKGVPMLGFNDMDFAFIMNGTIPNWSLPMFYKETSDWSPLLRRKSTK